MKKKIAIPTQKGKLSEGISINTVFSLFEFEDDRLVRIEQEQPEDISPRFISLWLACKNITELYIGEITNELKDMLTCLGIVVKRKEELSDNDFFNLFVFE